MCQLTKLTTLGVGAAAVFAVTAVTTAMHVTILMLHLLLGDGRSLSDYVHAISHYTALACVQ
jgi:hypothetical protein